MKQHTLQPKLRFPEFNGDWEIYKFNDLYEFKTTNSLSRDKLNYEIPNVKNIHYGDIHVKFRTIFDITKENVPYINTDVNLEKIKEDSFLKEGDVIIADASENYDDIGKSIEILNLNNENVVSGLHTFLARKKTDINYITYNSFYFQTNNYRHQVYKIAQGTKVLSLSSNRVAELKLLLPSLPEQQKIADYLSTIDTKITLLEEKKTELSRYKKAMMQKLFSQEIRFKDENGNDFSDWEEKRLGEICKKSSSNLSANQIEDNIGDYKLYGANGLIQLVDFYQEDQKYISIVKDGAGVGRVLLCDEYSSVLGTLDKILTLENNSLIFIYYTLLKLNFTKYITGSTIPHIYFKDYSKEKLLIPSLQEQQKIADFLSAIDESIDKVSEQIKETQSFKKAMLQQMFV